MEAEIALEIIEDSNTEENLATLSTKRNSPVELLVRNSEGNAISQVTVTAGQNIPLDFQSVFGAIFLESVWRYCYIMKAPNGKIKIFPKDIILR